MTDLEFGSALRVGAVGEAAAVRLRASGSYERPWQHTARIHDDKLLCRGTCTSILSTARHERRLTVNDTSRRFDVGQVFADNVGVTALNLQQKTAETKYRNSKLYTHTRA